MKAKLIMVEGIPGSGKSTFAQKIADYYRNKGIKVDIFNEGQAHPADLAWSACVPLDLLDKLLLKYSGLESKIRKNMHINGDYAIIAYTQVETDDRSFYEEFEDYEVYDNRVAFETFCNLHYGRWEAFGKHADGKDTLNIFECAFFQNHVNELQNYQLANKTDIENHLNKLLYSVLNLSPVIIYLSQPDIRETIERVAKERVSEHSNWIDRVVEYVENTPYGKIKKLKGFDGVIRCMEDRKQIELEILKKLPINTVIIENDDYDWDGVWNKLEAYLCTIS